MKYIRIKSVNEDFIKGYDDDELDAMENPIDSILQKNHVDIVFDDLLEMIDKDIAVLNDFDDKKEFQKSEMCKSIPEFMKDLKVRNYTFESELVSSLRSMRHILTKSIEFLKENLELIKTGTKFNVYWGEKKAYNTSLYNTYERVAISLLKPSTRKGLLIKWKTINCETIKDLQLFDMLKEDERNPYIDDNDKVLNKKLIQDFINLNKFAEDILKDSSTEELGVDNLSCIDLFKLLQFIVMSGYFLSYYLVYQRLMSLGILSTVKRYAESIVEVEESEMTKEYLNMSVDNDIILKLKNILSDLEKEKPNTYYKTKTYKLADSYIRKIFNYNKVILRYYEYLDQQIKSIEN